MTLLNAARRQAESAASAIRRAARQALQQPAPSLPFPVIGTCPAPTCVCAETPSGLDIDRSKTLNGTVAPYAKHILISTGQHDWKSKIEDEKDVPGWGSFTARLKSEFGRRGRFHDPYHNVLISASSFPTLSQLKPSFATSQAVPNPPDLGSLVDVLLFPSFCRVSGISSNAESSLEDLAHEFLLSKTRQSKLAFNPRKDDNKHLSNFTIERVETPTVLICSHASRDSRCGVLGPLLKSEFEKVCGTAIGESEQPKIGLISHIGGHKWAGNVIVYLPPGWKSKDAFGDGASKLSGMGIWYGRVEPKHVQGIVNETILNGNVIRELFRGGIDESGQTLRM